MKKLLLLLAAVAMILPSCGELEEAIDKLDNRLDKLEQEAIPTIDEQIAAVNVSLDALDSMDKELKDYIDGLQVTADNLQKQINDTNSKIDAVKEELQGEISTAKSEVLAELMALETELKNELATINSTIETLKAKDEELDKKIADLRTYVNNELTSTENWVNATFATLEQYNALVSEIATIKEQIKAINQSITDLEIRLTTKINEDIATAVATLNADIQQKVKDITDAYTAMVNSAKEELTTAYTSAIQTAITTLDNSLKTWVGEQLAGYYTIAEVDALLATTEQEINNKLDAQKAYLEGLINELSTATSKGIADNKTLIDALRNDVTTLQGENAEQATKIAENATAISANAQAIIDNATAISKNGENIEANEKLIADNKALIEANTKAIAENKSAIEALKSSTSTAIAKNATDITQNASNIAKNAALISQNATAIANNQLAILHNATDIAQLQQDLATTTAEITEAYKKAISDAINTNNGVIDTKIAAKVSTINTRIDNEVSTINNAINALKSRVATLENEVSTIKQQIAEILGDIADMKEDISKLLARIQSVSYIPTYDDGKATVNYNGSTSRVTLDFEISPKDAVAELANVWQNAVSLKAVYTQTRAVEFIEMPITKFEADTENGVITVTASGENLSDAFFAGTQTASARLAISDGNNSVTSDYVPMVVDSPGSLWIYTAEDLAKLNDPSVVSATLMASIDMTGKDWTPIENFAGDFNGGNHEIKGLTAPLFGTVTATSIKNVHLVDVNIVNNTDTRKLGAVACYVDNTSAVIKNCSAQGTMTVSGTRGGTTADESSYTYIGGVIGKTTTTQKITGLVNKVNISVGATFGNRNSRPYISGCVVQTGGMLANCTNLGTIETTTDFSSLSFLYVGGVVWNATKITSCVNGSANSGESKKLGAITINGSVARTCYMAGITSNNTGKIVVSGCRNYAPLKLYAETVTSSEGNVFAAGVVAISNYVTTITNCENYGDIDCKFTAIGVSYVGGVTTVFSANILESISDCSNHGDITIDGSDINTTLMVGGVINNMGCSATISNLTNSGNITINNYKGKASGYIIAGGITGRIDDTAAILAGSIVNTGDITLSGTLNQTDGKTIHVGGIAGRMISLQAEASATFANSGAITFNGTANSNIHLGGIFGSCDTNITLNAKNTGNITCTGTVADGKEAYVGGIVGGYDTTRGAVSGARCFCTLKVAEGYENVGMVTGLAYDPTAEPFTNCHIGGYIDNEDGSEPTKIEGYDFHTYIYGDRIFHYEEADEAKCGWLENSIDSAPINSDGEVIVFE